MATEHRHPNSLLPKGMHDPRLLEFLDTPIDRRQIRYIVALLEESIHVDESSDRSTPSGKLPTPPVTPTRQGFSTDSTAAATQDSTSSPAPVPRRLGDLPPLEDFITHLTRRANTSTMSLMATIVYLKKLGAKLSRTTRGSLPCTRHRVFFATINLATKYVNDSNPRNKHWAAYSKCLYMGVDGATHRWGWEPQEVNCMEHQLIKLLDYDFIIREGDFLDACSPFLPGGASYHEKSRPHRLDLSLASRKLQARGTVLPPTPVSPTPPRRQPIAVTSTQDMEDDADCSSPSPSPSPVRAVFATADLAVREMAITSEANRATRSEAVARLGHRLRSSVDGQAPLHFTATTSDASVAPAHGMGRTTTAMSSASSSTVSLTEGSSAASESEAMSPRYSSSMSGSEHEELEPRIALSGASYIDLTESDTEMHSVVATAGVKKGKKRSGPPPAFRLPYGEHRRVTSGTSTICGGSPRLGGSAIRAKFTPAPTARSPSTSSSKARVASVGLRKGDASDEQVTMSTAASLPSLASRAREAVGRVFGGFGAGAASTASSSSRRLVHSRSSATLRHRHVSGEDRRTMNSSESATSLMDVDMDKDQYPRMSVETLKMLMDVEAAMADVQQTQ